jgi:ppGpp synthetase/RelA/SpoT-type nucleotidyltranferase
MDLAEYERQGRSEYAAFASIIAAILRAAIDAEEGYRLHLVTDRAKTVKSLREKLEKNGKEATTILEAEIKDLAGCRIIFYTNDDVTRFIHSGIIDQNFDVLEAKVHHPSRHAQDANEWYVDNQFIVKLRQERLDLPEYARFANLRCEIQIHTILNHAWSETAHDTIYKPIELGNFGTQKADAIKSRMAKIMSKYLIPAGYELQKVVRDFQRLVEGKELFDEDILEAIVEAADNNARSELLEKFEEYVLSFYDDLPSVYPRIVDHLIAAAKRARTAPLMPIETPFGQLPPKTFGDVLEGITGILEPCRYCDAAITFKALVSLYALVENEEEKETVLKLAKNLGKPQLDVWCQGGDAIPAILVDSIGELTDADRHAIGPLLTALLGEMLETEATGAKSTSSTILIRRGTLSATEMLRRIRAKAIDLLKHQFDLGETEEERHAVLRALHHATRPPYGLGIDPGLARMLANDTHTIMKFHTEVAGRLSLELLQETENWVLRVYWGHAGLPEPLRDDPDLVALFRKVQEEALAFRDVVNRDQDFVTYKTLVGYDSVFPPAWEEMGFGHDSLRVDAYREDQVGELLGRITEADAEAWFSRINRFAKTESVDAATFPVFCRFLERFAEQQPRIVLGYLDRIPEPLARFLAWMLNGLMRSRCRSQTLAWIDECIRTGEHLGQVAVHLKFADPCDEALLRRVLDRAIQRDDRTAALNVMIAAANQFPANPGHLVENHFLPALRHLAGVGDRRWVKLSWFTWFGSKILRSLNQVQAREVLSALVPCAKVRYHAEDVAATIAEDWPAEVIAFLGDRQAFAGTDAAPESYEVIPFEPHRLGPPLARVPDIVLEGACVWFENDPDRFSYRGARLLAEVFPELANGLAPRMQALIEGGRESDLDFVLGVLSGFEGKPCVYDLVRAIVAALETGNPLLVKAQQVLIPTGVVVGAYGFVELCTKRKALLQAWLDDPGEQVKVFASARIRELDQRIAAENRRAEATIALRKLDYDEELGGGPEED